MSAIKISGMPSQGGNTITLQQNKTLNGSRYSVCSNSKYMVSSPIKVKKEDSQLEERKKSTFNKNAHSFRFKVGKKNTHKEPSPN